MTTVLIAGAGAEAHDAVGLATSAGYSVIAVTSGAEAILELDRHEIDVVVTNLRLADVSGLDFCRRVVERHDEIPVLLTTNESSVETAISAIRAGAYDYLPRPLTAATLVASLDRAVRHRALRLQITRLTSAVVAGTPTIDQAPVEPLAALPTLRALERRYIARILALTANNKTLASRVLGIDRKTLYRKLEALSVPDSTEAGRGASRV